MGTWNTDGSSRQVDISVSVKFSYLVMVWSGTEQLLLESSIVGPSTLSLDIKSNMYPFNINFSHMSATRQIKLPQTGKPKSLSFSETVLFYLPSILYFPNK